MMVINDSLGPSEDATHFILDCCTTRIESLYLGVAAELVHNSFPGVTGHYVYMGNNTIAKCLI